MVNLMKGREVEEKNDKTHDEVTDKDLYDNFYITLGKITSNLNKKENKEKVFEKASLGKGLSIGLMIFLTFLVISIKPVSEYQGYVAVIGALIFPGIGFSILIGALLGAIKMPKWFAIVWGSLFGGMPWAGLVLPSLLLDPIYLVTYIVGIICIVFMMLFMRIMPKRTPYGNEMLGKIKGFKNFLETVEKEKLEALVMDDPEYFYNILPYTYVLEVSDKWIKNFETISLQAPDWYSGTDTFNAVAFGSFMNSTMTSAQTAMTSSPSSDGGGSGGGSSGGGSGGGGGGSW